MSVNIRYEFLQPYDSRLGMLTRVVASLAASSLFLASDVPALHGQYPSVPPPPPCHEAKAPPAAASSRGQATRLLGVVLFQNTATSSADAFLGRAVSIELADALLAESRLSIVTSQKFGYETVSVAGGVRDVARTLGVRYVLGGTVGRSQTGDITVTAELRRPSDGAVIWGLSRATQMRELPALVGEITHGVVDALTQGSAGQSVGSARLAGWGNTLPEGVVDHFMMGTYYSSLETISGYEAALAHFDSASRIDPRSPQAFGESALTIATMLEWGWWNYGEPRVRQMAERGLAAADRALQIDSANATAWMARGSLLAFKNPRSYNGALDAFRRAIARAPRDPEAHHWYGRALMQLGDKSSARSELEKALDLAPTNAGVLFDLAQLYRHDGGFSRACIMLDSAVAASPTAAQIYVLRALTRARRGELRFAWADAETGGRLGWPAWAQSTIAIVDAKARDTTGARQRIDAVYKSALQAGNRPQQWTGEYLAAALLASGQKDRALDILERIQPRGARLWFALTGPEFSALRGSQRYRTLVASSRPRR